MTSLSAFSTRLMPDGFGMPCASVWTEYSLSLHPEKTRLIEFGRIPRLYVHLRTITTRALRPEAKIPR